MGSQRDVKNRISSVKNIQKITRAMEMVAAARLRRAEQRIVALRPYAEAIRRLTRQAALDAGAHSKALPLLAQREPEQHVGLLLICGDRGLAGAFNSQIVRAGIRAGGELRGEGRDVHWYASGRRGVSSLRFRGEELDGAYTGFTDRPAAADARAIAHDLVEAFSQERLDRVEIFYNGYVSPLTQEVRHETLLPIAEASGFEEGEEQAGAAQGGERTGGQAGGAQAGGGQAGGGPAGGAQAGGHRALVEYEPEPREILGTLLPDYIETLILRALLESTASEHGARMTAMRNASENAGELITDLTLEMNRVRQAEITQEIMEVVAGAEGVT
jgi:F-type H+-transporting ATPase subunit gamma